MNDISDIIEKLTPIIISMIVALLFCYCIDKCASCNQTNLDNKQTIDSLTRIKNEQSEKIKHLDSIKNIKIDEVKKLDNDSTVKLFYKLIRE